MWDFLPAVATPLWDDISETEDDDFDIEEELKQLQRSHLLKKVNSTNWASMCWPVEGYYRSECCERTSR